MEELNRDWDQHFDAEHRVGRATLQEQSDRKLEAMQNTPSAPQSLQDHLTEQLPFLELPERIERLAQFIISHLDHNGYLLGHNPDEGITYPITLQDLSFTFPEQPVHEDEIEEALDAVQSLEPSGVGARDVRECLLLQITRETPHRDLVATLIRDHLEDIAANRMPQIQRRTGADLSIIAEAIDVLKHLDPRPGAQFESTGTHYIVPDVIVERTDDGGFEIRLTEDWIPNVRISKDYVPVMKDRTQPQGLRKDLKVKFQSAQWLLSAIEQRRDTLIKVTREIIEHQRPFLDEGPEHIQPLKMEQIAEKVGVHVTTVSRAVDDKWVQTPRGVFPLRRFFGGGTKNTQTGEDVAWEKIKQKLLEIIANEDKREPLSDEAIKKKFDEDGLPVARRTVTKYREALKIPSSRQRRNWSG
jgi:RNA polymerase sigma-54 factor